MIRLRWMFLAMATALGAMMVGGALIDGGLVSSGRVVIFVGGCWCGILLIRAGLFE